MIIPFFRHLRLSQLRKIVFFSKRSLHIIILVLIQYSTTIIIKSIKHHILSSVRAVKRTVREQNPFQPFFFFFFQMYSDETKTNLKGRYYYDDFRFCSYGGNSHCGGSCDLHIRRIRQGGESPHRRERFLLRQITDHPFYNIIYRKKAVRVL